MVSKQDPQKQMADLIGRIGQRTLAQLGKDKGAPVARFVRQYYQHVPPHDLRGRTPDNLFGAAFAHWRLAAKRRPTELRVRAYNPRLDDHGWNCDHTVVEVVNDDMPFLVDSVAAALNRMDIQVQLVIHPILRVRRGKDGSLIDVADADTDGAVTESFMHFEVTSQASERLDEIRATVEKVLADVRAAVEDWKPMLAKLKAIRAELGSAPPKVSADELDEAVAFLDWLANDHFTFLGFREYELNVPGGRAKGTVKVQSGLGVLRDPEAVVFKSLRSLEAMPPEVRDFVQRPALLMMSKSNRRATVHRSAHMDTIGVKRFDDKGKVVGLRLFAGLFTSNVYSQSPREIPLLRQKIRSTIARSGFRPASHDGKALAHILETYPRDELFQASEDNLYDTSLGILNLQERQRVALFIRRDDFERFVSCLVFVPRDRYTTQLRHRIQEILEQAFGGEVTAFFTQLGDSALARLHLIVGTDRGRAKAYDATAIEAAIVEASRSWADALEEALVAADGEERGLALLRRYRDAFPAGYVDRFRAEAAVADVAKVEQVIATGSLGMSPYRPLGAGDDEMRFKVFNPNAPIPLSDVLPMLEHMGLKVQDEIPHAVRPVGAGIALVMIHDFGLRTRDGSAIDLKAAGEPFQDAFARVWRGEVESDGFNALVLGAGLTWREIVVLRAVCKYLRQAGIAFSQAYMEQTLANNPRLAALIVRLFLTRFDPKAGKAGERRLAQMREELAQGLDAVESADEDRILRRFVNVVESMLRTNYFQPAADGGPRSFLSFKLNSRAVDELPLPRPMVEVWVYSPRVEAIHLRGGKVARGGIRWSDRREDFRTEILSLMKTQTVKNAVIVPVGAKGGFVVKRPPAGGDREAVQAEGVECYRIFVGALLDITDNLKGEDVMPPPGVVRLDDDDPYLVVAADKGTATFSDIANAISFEHGFWLGDAFASGGSVGYDHKKIGITARGAWESVKRHFREVGKDIQGEDFTVVGVGDMSGDVFGNGVLQSPHIKLLAAFNHLHIFVDPDPDPAKSLAERRRLFALARSSWIDYDHTLLSDGGAVYDRRAKSITLSHQVRKLFGIARETVPPNELLQAILRARVDLLWFGGIGTFVKASHESHAEAGDRTNDAVRVSASDLRCKVIGEGANLGMTQRARVEFALAGGKVNTDSIDNSGGVDCSDHEVNIKILLDSVVAAGELTEKKRNALLAQMTDEVAALVLRDNYLQSQAITVAVARGHEVFDDQIRMMRMLERAGRLNRDVDALPDDDALAERNAHKLGFTRPEIAVLMPIAKIWLNDELLSSDLPDDPQLDGDLMRYFPTPLREGFADAIRRHRLRREIIATGVTNSMINRVGGYFITQLMEKTGMTPVDIARAYIVARDTFGLRDIWAAIEALDTKVPAEVQARMLLEGNRLIEHGTLWFLRHAERPIDIGAQVSAFRDDVATLAEELESLLPDHYRADLHARAAIYTEKGVPADLALRVAGIVNMASCCEIVRLAQGHDAPVAGAAALYFAVGARFHMGRLRAAAEGLEADTHWQQMAVAALIDDLFANQGALTSQILDGAKTGTRDAKAVIDAWAKKRGVVVETTENLLAEIWNAEAIDFPMLSVASRRLGALI